MKPVEIFLPDIFAEDVANLSPEEYDQFLARVEKIQVLKNTFQKTGFRKVTFWYLLGTGSIILTVSLSLIISQAFGVTKLPDDAITALIGSVAVEFVGMLWMVIRSLFSQGSNDGQET